MKIKDKIRFWYYRIFVKNGVVYLKKGETVFDAMNRIKLGGYVMVIKSQGK